MNFDVKRKPTFIVISVLLPTLFLSVLNLLVFVIPVDSGEKISYGMWNTQLLLETKSSLRDYKLGKPSKTIT